MVALDKEVMATVQVLAAELKMKGFKALSVYPKGDCFMVSATTEADEYVTKFFDYTIAIGTEVD